MATRLAQVLEDVPTNTPGRRFQKAVWRAIHALRKTRKELADVGERINATVAHEMEWANRTLASHREVQQLRFNDRGEARVVRVSVPVTREVPKVLPATGSMRDSLPAASTGRSKQKRPPQQETLRKQQHEDEQEPGWEIEMPLRFRVVRARLKRATRFGFVPPHGFW